VGWTHKQARYSRFPPLPSPPLPHLCAECQARLSDPPCPVQIAKIVLPGMKARRRGLIVNLGSGSGHLPACPLLAVYAGSKAYVDQFSRSLDAEYRQYGIAVQCQAPFFVATKLSKIRCACEGRRRRGCSGQRVVVTELEGTEDDVICMGIRHFASNLHAAL
jgi:short-subunit dehydrogenase